MSFLKGAVWESPGGPVLGLHAFTAVKIPQAWPKIKIKKCLFPLLLYSLIIAKLKGKKSNYYFLFEIAEIKSLL